MSTKEELYDQGDQLKDAGELEQAIAKMLEAVAIDESYALPHSALAVLYGRVGKHEEAVKHGQRVCELEPQEAFSFTAMSVTFQRAYDGTKTPEFIQLAEDAMARSRMIQG
jgi:tetratricopeptide (TPR) repeat protein